MHPLKPRTLFYFDLLGNFVRYVFPISFNVATVETVEPRTLGSSIDCFLLALQPDLTAVCRDHCCHQRYSGPLSIL